MWTRRGCFFLTAVVLAISVASVTSEYTWDGAQWVWTEKEV
jgi:hypothetical protein